MDTRAELVNKDIARDVSYLKEEMSNIKQNLQIFCENDFKICKRLANVENHLFRLFGEKENHFSIYEMIDLVVEMNKSLKQLKESFASSQSQFQVFRNKQEDISNKVAKHKETLSSTNRSFDLVFEKIESLGFKQVKKHQSTNLIYIQTFQVKISDLQLINEKAKIMEKAIAEMKEKMESKIIRTERREEEGGFNKNRTLRSVETKSMGKILNVFL